jgi:hypothetical protein
MPQRSSSGRRQHFIANPGTRVSGSVHASGNFAPQITDASTATWTNATTAPTNLDLDVSQMASAIVYINETTVVGGSIDLQLSVDGTNFDGAIPIDLTIRGSGSSTHSGGAGDKVYSFNVSAYTTLRVRLSTVLTSGTVAVTSQATSAWGHGVIYTLPATTAGSFLVDTELPAAALLADNTATPTAPAVGAFGMVYDGATWDFARGTAADGVLVNLGSNNDVTDGGGTLTVDAPVGTPVFVRLSDGSAAISTLPVSLASVPSHAVTNVGTFAVQATLAAGATAIAKAEDVASADADVGVPALAVRKATPANTSGTDGDYEFLQMSAGRLWVDPSGVTLTVGSHAVTIASGGVASGAVASGAVATGAFASGSIASGAVASGAVASGAFASGSVASGAIASGAVASGAFASGSIVAGAVAAGASSFVKLEDVASADADAGVPAMAVRKATPANTSGTDGDYEMLQMSAGRLWVDPSGVTLTVASHAVTNAGTFAVQADTELPPAAALADAVPNPTVPGVGAFNMVWNSNASEWERFPGDTTGIFISASSPSVPCNTEISAAVTPSDALTNSTTMGQVLTRLEGYNGSTWDRLRSNTTAGLAVEARTALPAVTQLSETKIDRASSGDFTVITATGSQTGRLQAIFLVAAGATTFKFQDNASTDLTGYITLYPGGSFVLDLRSEPWFTTGVNATLTMNFSTAAQVSGRAYWTKSA